MHTLGLFLGQKIAFDSRKHNILLRKLPLCGIKGTALNLLESYPCYRFQYSSIANASCTLEGPLIGPVLSALA